MTWDLRVYTRRAPTETEVEARFTTLGMKRQWSSKSIPGLRTGMPVFEAWVGEGPPEIVAWYNSTVDDPPRAMGGFTLQVAWGNVTPLVCKVTGMMACDLAGWMDGWVHDPQTGKDVTREEVEIW
ncbi:MAG: hypothetical protein Q8R28_15385 [Dehalococcoidia bacterium]|nr:hypothetical protein [Dehalococcoidia bacterium]